VQLKWTDCAEADLDHIENYIAEDNDPAVALDVVFRVINSVELILPGHPHAGRLGRVKGTRELAVDGVPFLVIYRIVDSLKQIQILRVMHDAQQWPLSE
jgi:toxin ParE1/3/4